MAVTFLAILLIVLLVGVVLGSVGTAVMFSLSRRQVVQHSDEPPVASDPFNPYAPSQISTRLVGARIGCGVASAILLLVAMVLFVTLFWTATRSATQMQATPTPAPPVSTPAPAGLPSPDGTPAPGGTPTQSN